jgi:virginiamycin B lyase
VRGALLAVLLLAATPAAAETVRELPLPHAFFPTGLAIAGDGTVLIADGLGDQLIRFAPETQRFSSVELERNARPRDVVVDAADAVWLAESGMGRVDRLRPGAGRVEQFPLPSLVASRTMPAPWTLALSPARDVLWFTVDSGVVGRVPVSAAPVRRGFAVEELPVGRSADRLSGIAVAPDGTAWVAAAGTDQLIHIAGGGVQRLSLAAGSRPRGVAVGPDGTVWATLYGRRELLRVDPRSLAQAAWPLPAGDRAAPGALTVDRAGAVWIADIGADAIVRFDPVRQRFTSFELLTPRARVQALAVDGRGRVWYVGAVSRRLGVIE